MDHGGDKVELRIARPASYGRQVIWADTDKIEFHYIGTARIEIEIDAGYLNTL
jgi:hypothetical protein